MDDPFVQYAVRPGYDRIRTTQAPVDWCSRRRCHYARSGRSCATFRFTRDRSIGFKVSVVVAFAIRIK